MALRKRKNSQNQSATHPNDRTIPNETIAIGHERGHTSIVLIAPRLWLYCDLTIAFAHRAWCDVRHSPEVAESLPIRGAICSKPQRAGWAGGYGNAALNPASRLVWAARAASAAVMSTAMKRATLLGCICAMRSMSALMTVPIMA
jgi:hypothetical protein